MRSCRLDTLRWVFILLLLAGPAQAQAPLPTGWPGRIELGMADGPGGAAAMKRTAPFAFRYQYLAGGVNTGNGWATWNTNGDFPRFYIQDSSANGIVPVFTLLHAAPVVARRWQRKRGEFQQPEQHRHHDSVYGDLKLFFRRLAHFPRKKSCFTWNRISGATCNSARRTTMRRTVPAKVAETGLPELAGLPSSVSGFARAVLRLRDTYAPNVIVGYHLSVWGTRVDIALSNPSDATVDALGTRAAVFYTSLEANFDIAFAEFSDRDSGFHQYVNGDAGRSLVGRRGFPAQRPLSWAVCCRSGKAYRDVADSTR